MGPLRASDEGEGSESYRDGGGTPLASALVDSMQQEQQMDLSNGEHDATIQPAHGFFDVFAHLFRFRCNAHGFFLNLFVFLLVGSCIF